jgi:dolichol-phosphate mannosyltransferase
MIITKNKILGVIIPCLNEEQNINNFYLRIIKIIKQLNVKYKIYFIDDGSVDNTWKKISELNKIDKNILGIKLSRNFGQQTAIKAGIDFVNTDYLLIIDADLQDPPELIKDMYLKLINHNLDIVYAERIKNNEGFFKKYSSILFYKFFNYVCNIKIPNNVSDFRIVNKKVITELKKINEKEPFYRGMIPWLGFKSGKIEFNRPNRMHGQTKANVKTMTNLTLNAIFNYSNLPRRLSFILSLIFFILFIILSAYILENFLLNNKISDFILIFTVITFYNFIIFFILGLISEYLGKIFIKVNNEVLYAIDEKIF